jgi:hypothetical protein
MRGPLGERTCDEPMTLHDQDAVICHPVKTQKLTLSFTSTRSPFNCLSILDNRSYGLFVYGVVLKEAIDLFDLYHTLGTDVWFTDVDDPLVVVYDNFRNRKLNRLPPVHVEALAVVYNGINGLRGWIPARGLWSLAHPDDRKGWVLTENETTASGGLRSPRVTTSYLGATFSFNANITTGHFPRDHRGPCFIIRADVKINNTINNPRVLLGRVPGLLLRLRLEWTCPSGQGGRHDYRSENWRSDASLPRLFGKDYRFWGKKIMEERNCRFTFTNLGFEFAGSSYQGPTIIPQVRLLAVRL